MKTILISELRGRDLAGPLLHPSGVVLVREDEICDALVVELLGNHSIEYLIAPDAGETLESIAFKIQFDVIDAASLQPNQVIEHAIYDDKNVLLLEAGAPVSEAFRQSLSQRGIKQIMVKRKQNHSSEQGLTLRTEIESMHRLANISADLSLEDAVEMIAGVQMNVDSIATPTESEDFKAAMEKNPASEGKVQGSVFGTIVKDMRGEASTEEQKNQLSDLTIENLEICKRIYEWFSRVTIKQEPSNGPLTMINEVVSNVMGGIIQHKDIMGLSAVQSDSEDYLISHSLAVATVSCLIGTRMELGVAQVKVLTSAGLLADVGMLRIPKTIITKPTPLDNFERARVMKHTEIGLEMLLKVKDLPHQVPWVVYQSHERCDGSGYPKGKSGRIIHKFAKIIAVADIFVAMCAVRPYRDAHLPYSAIETLLNLTAQNKLDPEVVKALLEVQSLFPIGSLIQLEDGRVARVVASNPEQYTRPVIVILSDNSLDRIDLLANPQIKVAKPLPNPKGMKLKTKLVGM